MDNVHVSDEAARDEWHELMGRIKCGDCSAHDAMRAISKLLHEQVPGGEGQS